MRIHGLLLLMISLSGCSGMVVGGGAAGSTASVGNASVGAASANVEDSAITTAVKRSLAADRAVSVYGINVRTRNGRVTLSGSVGSRRAYDQAERLTIQTEGVKSVQNRIMVQTTE